MSNKDHWKASIKEHLRQIEYHSQQIHLLLAAIDEWDLNNGPEEQTVTGQQTPVKGASMVGQFPTSNLLPPTQAKPKRGFQFQDATFSYEVKDEKRNQRLMAFYKGLTGVKWIDVKTPMKQFLDLFQGERLYHRIRWTGSKSALAYLFKQLERNGLVTMPHARIWTTVRSHFVQPDGQPFEGDLKDQQVPGEKTARIIQAFIRLLDPADSFGE